MFGTLEAIKGLMTKGILREYYAKCKFVPLLPFDRVNNFLAAIEAGQFSMLLSIGQLKKKTGVKVNKAIIEYTPRPRAIARLTRLTRLKRLTRL